MRHYYKNENWGYWMDVAFCINWSFVIIFIIIKYSVYGDIDLYDKYHIRFFPLVLYAILGDILLIDLLVLVTVRDASFINSVYRKLKRFYTATKN